MAALSKRTEAQSSRRAAIERSVLEATEALLDEGESFGELRIEQIAGRAGISRSAFYFYFRDKRDLLLRLTEDVSEALYAEADAWWSSAGDGEAELQRALEQMIALYREHGVLLRAVVEASAYDEAIAGFWRALVGRFTERTRERIELEHVAGRARGVPAQATAFSLTWMTERACYQWLVAGGSLADSEIVDGLVGVWLRAVYGELE